MHIEARWADDHFTEEGTWVHRRVDATDDDPPVVLRSVTLTDDLRAELGLGVPREWPESGQAITRRGR